METGKLLEHVALGVGPLMEAGLNKLPESSREKVADAVEMGGQVFCWVEPAPLCVIGMLRDSEGTLVELFRVTNDPATH